MWAMQLNLRVRQPIAREYDDAVAEVTDSTADKTLAVLDQEKAIRNGGVLVSYEVRRDFRIYTHDTSGREVGKSKRIFASDFGVDKLLVELVHRADWPRRAQLKKPRQGCNRWDRLAEWPVAEPRYR